MIKTEQLAKLFLQQGGSIVDYMKSLNIDSSKTNRAKLAKEHGIENYSGTAEQNIRLLNILKKKYSKTNTQVETQPKVVQKQQDTTDKRERNDKKTEKVVSKEEPGFWDQALQWGRKAYDKVSDAFNAESPVPIRTSSGAYVPVSYQMGYDDAAKVVKAINVDPSVPIITSQGAYTPVSYQISDDNAAKVVDGVKKVTESIPVQAVKNVVTNPVQGATDLTLYLADIAGLPSNATNYVRDLNVSLPYRGKAAISAFGKSLLQGSDFNSEYQSLLSQPNMWMKQSITPLVNTNINFSDAELDEIRKMAGDKYYIGEQDIARTSRDGKYGSKGSIVSKLLDPNKVVQTAIGQANGDANAKTITDVYDFNNMSEKDLKDNAMYENMGGGLLSYENIRAKAPLINSTKSMPNNYKLQTKLQF